jgi:ribosomal protein S18 acetylase RimI-like enzyme
MIIRRYLPADSAQLFKLLRDEGNDWECYYGTKAADKYRNALQQSITYLAFEGNVLCGYARCREDDGFGIYVYDLLFAKPFRGQGIGRKLMEQVYVEFPNDTVYVMSDVDGYYSKLDYEREGSIFIVKPP